MLNAVAWVRPRVSGLRRLVGFEHQVDGRVAVGVDAHLETGGVHLQDVLHDLVAGHGEDAMVAATANVGFRQVGRARCDCTVGYHLDATDAQPVVAHAGADASLAESREVAIPHDGIHAQAEVAGVAAFLVGDQFVVGDPGVVNAGQAGAVQHLADDAETLAPGFGGFDRQLIFAQVIGGAFVDYAVQPSGVRVASQATARRVRRFVVVAGPFQRQGVTEIDVTGAVGYQDGMISADGVQVFPAQETVFGGLGVVELESLHPFTGRRSRNPFAQRRLDVADGWERAVGGHHVARAAAEHMDVRVDESGQHGLAGQVQYLGVRADERLQVGIAAHPNEPAVAHGNGGSARQDGSMVMTLARRITVSAW